MAARSKKKQHQRLDSAAAPLRLDAGWTMVLLSVVLFMTALGFDTSLQSTFDLSKLAYLYACATVLIAGFFYQGLTRGTFELPRTPLDWPVLATIAAVVAATLFAVDWRVSVFGAYKNYEGLIQILISIAMFYAAATLRRSQVVVVMAMIVIAAFGASVYGVIQRLGMDSLGWSKLIEGRVISTFGNPVFFGLFLVMAVPLAAGLALWKPEKRVRDPLSTLIWGAALIVMTVFMKSIYPAFQSYRGAESATSTTRGIVLLVVAVGLTIALGRRLMFRPTSLGWNPALGWINLGLALGVSAAFYCSKSVGALAALAVGMAAFVLYVSFQRESLRQTPKRLVVLIAGLVLLNLGLNLWPETSTLTRLSTLVKKGTPNERRQAKEAEPPDSLAPTGSLYKRALLFRSGLNIVKEYPLFGVGPDGIERVISKEWAADYQLEYGKLVEVEGFENRVHNELLEVAATQGLVGLAARLWLWIAVALMLWRARRVLPPGDQPVLAGLASSWIVLLAAMFFEYPTIPVSLGNWVILGLIVAWIQEAPEVERPTPYRVSIPAGLAAGLALVGLVLVAWFWKVAVIDPFRADQHYMRGEIFNRSKRPAQAAVEYTKAAEIEPTLHVYQEKLGAVLVGMASSRPLEERENLARQVIEHSRISVEASPWRANGYAFLATGQSLLADALEAREGDQAEIERLRRENKANLEKAIEINPYNAGLRVAYARDAVKHQDWSLARNVVIEVLEWWPRNEQVMNVVNQISGSLINDTKLDQAEEFLNEVGALIHRSNRIAWLGAVGRLRWVEKDWSVLEEIGAEMIELDPKNTEGYRYTSVAHAQTGELDLAAEECAKLLEIDPEDDYGQWLQRTIAGLKARATTQGNP